MLRAPSLRYIPAAHACVRVGTCMCARGRMHGCMWAHIHGPSHASPPSFAYTCLQVRELFNPDYGMFSADDATRLHWFRPSSLELDTEFELVGILIGERYHLTAR